MILDLVSHDDPILTTPAQKFDFDAPPMDPVELARNMAETMINYSGLGLAAPQVGIPYRVIAISSNPIGVLFNPVIVDSSEATTTLDEACLSFPGLSLKVERPRIIRLRYQLPNGEVMTKQFADLTARIICHEIDHVNGITFIEAQPGLKRDFAKKKWAKLVKRGVVRVKPNMIDMTQLMDYAERATKEKTK